MPEQQQELPKFVPGKIKVLDPKYLVKEVDGWLLGDTGLGYHLVDYDNPNVKPDYWPTHLNTGCQIGAGLLGLPLRKCQAFLWEIRDMAPWSKIFTMEEANKQLVQTGILKQVNQIARKYQ